MRNVELTTDELAMLKHSLEKAIWDYKKDIDETMADAVIEENNRQMVVDYYREEINRTSALLFKIVQQVPVWM